MIMKKISIIILLGFAITTCKQNRNKDPETNPEFTKETLQISDTTTTIYGNYVDDSYQKRKEGYDWVAVTVKENVDNAIFISVRSRADKKDPTCTFDAKAYKNDKNTYESIYDGKKIIYKFSENSIHISSENKEDEKILYFFCSGGATLAGTYTKINEALDTAQVDKTNFSKVLNFQNVGFNVSAIEKDGKNILTVFTFGLKEKDYNESFDLEGYHVIDAEVEDLNSDGSPELFIFTQSPGSGSYGNVLAFSVNNMKSMSQVYFPSTAENKKINSGYMGHDEFAILETYLVQRFPIYNEDDSNSNPTGGTRQVSYKLVEGEAMRKLEVNSISNY